MKTPRKSEEIISDIKSKDRWTLIAIVLFLLTLLATQVAVGWYIVERINDFERGIDCKLLITPENRTKVIVRACTEENKNDVVEKTEGGQSSPSFNGPEDLDISQSTVDLPPPASPASPINISPQTPVQPPQEPKPSTPILGAERKFETRINPQTGKTEIRYEGDTIWVEAQVQP